MTIQPDEPRPTFRTWKATIGGVPHQVDHNGKFVPTTPKEDDK